MWQDNLCGQVRNSKDRVLTLIDINSTLHCSIYSGSLWTRMCDSIDAKTTISSKREIRCNNMWRCYISSVNWHLGTLFRLQDAESLFCLSHVVHCKIRRSRSNPAVDYWWGYGHQCSHNFRQIIYSDNGRPALTNCRVKNGILPCSGYHVFGT